MHQQNIRRVKGCGHAEKNNEKKRHAPGAALGRQPALVQQVKEQLGQPAGAQLCDCSNQVHHIELRCRQLVRLHDIKHVLRDDTRV